MPSRAPDPNADKQFAIKRWVNWDTTVAEVEWPDQNSLVPGWQPGPTRDFFDADDTVFDEISDGDLVTNILDRRELATRTDDDGVSDNISYPFDFGCDSDVSSVSGLQCELTGNRALFLASVERLRADSPFNMSRGFAVMAELDDNPDVEFWGEDGGDGCTVGVCNVEHNGPSDDDFEDDRAFEVAAPRVFRVSRLYFSEQAGRHDTAARAVRASADAAARAVGEEFSRVVAFGVLRQEDAR